MGPVARASLHPLLGGKKYLEDGHTKYNFVDLNGFRKFCSFLVAFESAVHSAHLLVTGLILYLFHSSCWEGLGNY